MSRAAPTDWPRLAIGVAISTIGRPYILAATVEAYRGQSRAPDAIFVCAPTPADISDLAIRQPPVSIMFSPPGSCVQRNYIIDRADDYDILLFSDDDFLPRSDYIEIMEKIFLRNPDIV